MTATPAQCQHQGSLIIGFDPFMDVNAARPLAIAVTCRQCGYTLYFEADHAGWLDPNLSREAQR